MSLKPAVSPFVPRRVETQGNAKLCEWMWVPVEKGLRYCVGRSANGVVLRPGSQKLERLFLCRCRKRPKSCSFRRRWQEAEKTATFPTGPMVPRRDVNWDVTP